MPFNKIISNPPYSKNLHLKILREAMKHGGEIVNLSPIRWLTDASAKYKPHSDYNRFNDICERLAEIEIISAEEATRLFDVPFWNDLGIYHLTIDGGLDYENFWKISANEATEAVIEKICKPVYLYKTIDSIMSKFNKNNDLPYWVNCPRVHGHVGQKDEYDIMPMRFELSLNKEDHENKNVYFATREEAENFYNSLRRPLYMFIKKCRFYPTSNIFAGLPILPTYKHKWTDADLYEYFDLTSEERKIIEEEMK